MIYSIMAAFLFGLGDVFLKISSVKLNSVKILILNALCTLPIALIIFLIFKGSFPSTDIIIKALLIQALSAFALMFMFFALIYGPVSIIASIVSAYSLVAVIGSVIFLNETLSLIQYISIFLIISGSVSITYSRENNKSKNVLWIFFAVLAAVLWGIWAMLAKPILSEIEPWTMGLLFSFIAPFIWLPYIIKYYKSEKEHKWNKWGIITGNISILLTSIGAIFFYISLQKIPVSISSPITSSHPFVTVVISYIFLKEKLKIHQYISIALILLGVILLK